MGGELDRLGARSLSGRQSDCPARTQIRLRVRREGRPQPVVPHDRAARCLGTADAHPPLQRLRHPARHLQRRLRRPAGERQRGPQGNQPAGSFRRPEKRHRAARPERGERRGGAAVRQDASRSAAQGTQARGQLPCRGRERPDDLARQGAADLLPLGAGLGPAQPGRGRKRVPLLDDLLVLPRRSRHEPAGQGRRHRGLRRFDHRRHGEHHQRRRPLAGRPVAPPACRLRRRLRRGQRGDRRQPGRGTGGVHAGQADGRRSQRAVAARPRYREPARRRPP